jgi:outer membrane cobalamin receptor
MVTLEFGDVRVQTDLINDMADLVLAPPELEGVVVKAYKWEEPLIRKDDPSRMVMTAGQIKANSGRKSPVRMIASFNPGVTTAANGDGLYVRGARTDAMCYFVDGVKMQTLTGVPPDAINTISVYTGGLPAKYGDVTGGVVAIDTKSYFDLYQQRNAGIR